MISLLSGVTWRKSKYYIYIYCVIGTECLVSDVGPVHTKYTVWTLKGQHCLTRTWQYSYPPKGGWNYTQNSGNILRHTPMIHQESLALKLVQNLSIIWHLKSREQIQRCAHDFHTTCTMGQVNILHKQRARSCTIFTIDFWYRTSLMIYKYAYMSV